MYNVYIRPLNVDDALTSYIWRNDSEVWLHTGSKPDKVITPEIEKNWIQNILKDNTCKRFAIIADNNYIGNIQLTKITEVDAEYHIFIGNKDWWGKKVSHLATFQLLNFAKEHLRLKKIYLSVRKQNLFAIKTYLKSSFKIITENEEWINMVCILEDLQQPTVSVFCMVYNHEKYIEKCLDSLLFQKCDFNYSIVLGEDCSTDNSREIILNYAEKYPGKFILLLHNENIGAQKNQEKILFNCKGKYIALCEGDDYWTDQLKLQKQVDFLEANEDFSICFHPVKILKTNGELVEDFITKVPTNYENRITLASNLNYIHTPSVVFRNVVKEEIHSIEFRNSPIGDYFLYMLISKYGKIGYLNDSMAVYRFGVGVFSAVSEAKQNTANLLLYTNLFAVEKNEKIKEIFYKNILTCAQFSENKMVELVNLKKVLKTRRHSIIERIYRFFK